MLLGDRFGHIFEEGHAVGRLEGIVEGPVHFELTVGVLMVVLVGRPAEFQHGVADLADHVVTPHQGRLIVAGLGLDIRHITDCLAVRAHQKELALDAGLERVSGILGFFQHGLEDVARRLADQFAVHIGIGREPADFRLPWQLDQACRVGDGEHVGIGRSHVEPAREAGKACPVLRHVGDGACGRELGPQRAEQVDKGNQEIFDPALAGLDCQINRHATPLALPVKGRRLAAPYSCDFDPGIQSVPASGTLAIAAASTVSATRSSGSRLCT